MAKLFVITGMAGSGKTSAAKQLAREQKIRNVFPDATNVENHNEKRAGFKSLGEIVARLMTGQDCIMDEPHLTNKEFRNLFISFCNSFLGQIDIRWIVFASDKLNCINNLKHAYDGNRDKIDRLISFKNQSKDYIANTVANELKDHGFSVEVKEVFSSSNQAFKSLVEAEEWLGATIDNKQL